MMRGARALAGLLIASAAAFIYLRDWRGDGGLEAETTAEYRWYGPRELAVVDGGNVLVDGFDRRGPVHPARLWGIEAPALGETCRPDARSRPWPCGAFSRDTLAAILSEGGADCFAMGPQPMAGEPEALWCRVGGVGVSTLMVQAGAAWARPAEAERLVPHQQRARARGLGLWEAGARAPGTRHRFDKTCPRLPCDDIDP